MHGAKVTPQSISVDPGSVPIDDELQATNARLDSRMYDKRSKRDDGEG